MKLPHISNHSFNFLHHSLVLNKTLQLCALLVSINLSIIIIAIEELNAAVYAVPLVLLLITFKVVWDPSNRYLSAIVILATCITFYILNSGLNQTKYKHQLELVYNLMQLKEDFNAAPMIVYEQQQQNNVEKRENLNIFFVETDEKKLLFTPKELCAIESAAKHNPHARVYVVSIRAEFSSNQSDSSSNSSSNFLPKNYPNIVWTKFIPFKLFEGTPLLDWWTRGEVFKSKYRLAHTADAARLALLWKHGGFYSDLDTITVRNLADVASFSSIGYMREERGDSIGNGVMSFSKQHALIEQTMTAFASVYKPNEWAESGPILLEKRLIKYCETTRKDLYKTQLINETQFEELIEKCKQQQSSLCNLNSSPSSFKCDVLIYPSSFYYPYNYMRTGLKKIFGSDAAENENDKKNNNSSSTAAAAASSIAFDLSLLKKSYSVHLYGKMSGKIQPKVGANTLFDYLASVNCPLVYKQVKHSASKIFY